MNRSAGLRAQSEALAAPLPALLAEAEHLASNVLMGEHGRRRAGMGDEFWQYRPATPGDVARSIDWRRSARSDAHFVREKEWQAAQSVLLWVDRGLSMEFASSKDLPTKAHRARLLGLAVSVLLVRGGERVGLAGLSLPPRQGELQLLRLADAFTSPADDTDYGVAESRALPPHARALYISDFLGDMEPVENAIAKAADRGVKGAFVQVLDPQEERFPFKGRTVFESIGGRLRFETRKAGALRDRYLERLAARKARLQDLARTAGWQYHCHHSSDSAQAALLWIYRALERQV